MRRGILLVASLLFFALVHAEAKELDEKLVWGTNLLTLMPACGSAPPAEELLADRRHAVSLKQFYRAGGENAPVTPTECRVAQNADNLFVVFRCTENDMAFPAMDHHVAWQSFLHSPSEQDAAFPDKVDFFVSPDMSKPGYYQFAATLDGRSFATKNHTDTLPVTAEDESANSTNQSTIAGFEATTIRKEKEWIVFMKIPWKSIGGKPASYFGVLPVRTRWRDAEVTSPVATDFADRVPRDLFIETYFAGKTAKTSSSTFLCKLPSGSLRWQRPALLTYPDAGTIKRIWTMQQSLPAPTTPANLAERVELTQRWVDLLVLEGLNFHAGSGSIVPEDMHPLILRRQVNAALRQGDLSRACRLLDEYLAKLDTVSRKWFADGSPGDIASADWKPISKCAGAEERGNVLILHCLAEDRAIDLHLALPKTGGVRLYADAEGYFKPAELVPLNLASNGDRISFVTAEGGKAVVEQKPFQITFQDAKGKVVAQIESGNVAFRFDEKGKVIAVDFKHRLAANETIFGFGEKFDRFNQNGNVLTLWGMDDWEGTTVGLRNESYQPVPVFHSSKGYSVFVNSTYRLRADLGRGKRGSYRLTQPGPVFDYYFWIAPPEQALRSYTALTGRPLLPPKWAFEPWMGRTGRGWNNTPAHNPVAEQERVVKQFAELDIPHSAIYAEGNGADSPELYDFLKPRGIKVLSWYFCVISPAFQAQLMGTNDPSKLAVLNMGPAKDIDYVDFTNPNALEISRRWWQGRLNLGLAGSMVDFGDRVPEDAIFYNGKSGAEMHNFYAYDYQRTYNQVFAEKRGDDFILFGRAAAPGTQKWAGQFAGDHRANFVGLQAVLNGALNLSACGFSTWGSDLGGFLGWPEPAVYMRWTQFACFSPLMRSHGRTPREPWEYGEPAMANYKRYAWVRENLLDYIYASAIQAHETGIPIMRSLVVAYPHEPGLAGISDEYMFGDDLLVAPVIREGAERSIVFPAGRWTSLWNGKVVNGRTEVKMETPLDLIPVYLREGVLMPVKLNRELEFGGSMTAGSLNALVVTPPASADQSTNATLRATKRGFVITLNKPSDVSYLLIYGASVKAVKLNGVSSSKLTSSEIATQSSGWATDTKIDRAVVHLPPAEAQKLEVPLSVEVEEVR